MQRIFRFSPNWSDPDTLEAITVAREDLIAGAVDAVRESALTKNKHHLLFVGPRGSGKTHLITLVHHRLSKMEEVQRALRIAWLNEDETSDSLLSLLLRIHRTLSKTYTDEFPAESTEAVYDITDKTEATDAITNLLLGQLEDRTLLLLVENLDAIFTDFGDGEQKRWRALIQNHPKFCTVATAQRLFQDVSDRDAPFFGFFRVEHLKPFSVDDASELLLAIARENEDNELALLLASRRGRARLRALHHLTGGNQRLFIILSEFVDRDSLESLVAPFEELVDEQLTPYYQERLRWLPTLQRRIVEYLCTVVKPQPVKAIARHLFATSQTVSSQLHELRRIGYLESKKRGRESLYELAEPLMRLSYEVKEARGRAPLRLLVDFLRVWYDHHELENRLKEVPEGALTTQMYFREAHLRSQAEGNLRLQYFLEEAEHIDPNNCSDEQIGVLRDLREESGMVPHIMRYGLALWSCSRFDEALGEFTNVIDNDSAPAVDRSHALGMRAVNSNRNGDFDAEVRDYTAIIDMGAASEIVVAAQIARASAFRKRGEFEAAHTDLSAVLETEGVTPDRAADAYYEKALVHSQKNEHDAAIVNLSSLINLEGVSSDNRAEALFLRAVNYNQLGDIEAATKGLRAALAMAPSNCVTNSRIQGVLALALMRGGSWKEAISYVQGGLDVIESQKSEYFAPISSYLNVILSTGHSVKEWAPRIDQLLAIYAEHNALANLASGLAESVERLKDSNLSTSGLAEWHSMWADRAESYPELALPTRLLATGIEYFAKGEDEVVLLDLPSEERRILAQTLGLGSSE